VLELVDGMEDVTTGTLSGYLFNNQTTVAGTSAKFGAVNAGDTLAFCLESTTIGKVLSSNPGLSADGLNHAYITTWGGGTLNSAIMPAGTYVDGHDDDDGDDDYDDGHIDGFDVTDMDLCGN
jgi:hypothetical protein